MSVCGPVPALTTRWAGSGLAASSDTGYQFLLGPGGRDDRVGRDSAAGNPFAYAADNPLEGMDPSGHMVVGLPGDEKTPAETARVISSSQQASVAAGTLRQEQAKAKALAAAAKKNKSKAAAAAAAAAAVKSAAAKLQVAVAARSAAAKAQVAAAKVADERAAAAAKAREQEQVKEEQQAAARNAQIARQERLAQQVDARGPVDKGCGFLGLSCAASGVTSVAKKGWDSFTGSQAGGCLWSSKLSDCVSTGAAVVPVLLAGATDGGAAAADLGADAAVNGISRLFGEDAAADAEGNRIADAAGKCVSGGESFSSDTRVVLATSGVAVPISQLKVGDKVLATSTKTGKTQAEPVAAVLVHHDTDLYDLTVKTSHGTAVIHTTSNHLFWDPSLNKFLPASNLKPGTHLKTPDGQSAVVVGGSVPAVHDGWMWDLSVPGNNDHDFYVQTATTAVLVHNCSPGEITGYTRHGLNQAISRDGVGVSPSAINDAVSNPISVAEQTGGKLKYTGQNAAVILSSTGRVISTWARNSAGWRIVRG